jgi:hypothetical protein
VRDDQSVWPTLLSLAECLCEELNKPDSDGNVEEPCFCGVVAGDAVLMDYVTDGGVMGWVRLTGSFPSTEFPTPDLTLACGTQYAHEVEIGVARRSPIVATGSRRPQVPPTVEQWGELARLQAADLAAIRRAVHCCLGGDGPDFVLGQMQQEGPQGGVLATYWSLFVEGT